MDSAGNTVKETVYFFNAHPDDLIGSAGMALRPADTGRYTLEVFDLTRGERGLTEAGVPMAECASMRTAEEEQACAMLGTTPRFLGEIDGKVYIVLRKVSRPFPCLSCIMSVWRQRP